MCYDISMDSYDHVGRIVVGAASGELIKLSSCHDDRLSQGWNAVNIIYGSTDILTTVRIFLFLMWYLAPLATPVDRQATVDHDVHRTYETLTSIFVKEPH